MLHRVLKLLLWAEYLFFCLFVFHNANYESILSVTFRTLSKTNTADLPSLLILHLCIQTNSSQYSEKKNWWLATIYSHLSCYYFINCTVYTIAWTLPVTAHPCGYLLGSLETSEAICRAPGANSFCWAPCGDSAAVHLLFVWSLS